MSDIVYGGMSDKTPLSDIDLRTRIAAVLIAHPDLISGKCHGIEEPELQFEHQDQWAAHVADAVIAELGLREEVERQRQYSWNPDRPTLHRYVTDWKADDE